MPTSPDNLPLITDYNLPADVPAANNTAMNAVQAALNNERARTENTYTRLTYITDWDAAVNAGFYTSSAGASNAPSTADNWVGIVTNDGTPGGIVHQIAWPHGAGPVPSASASQRAHTPGGWLPWGRLNNYDYSWDLLDNMTYLQHGPGAGVRRFAHGMAKDAAGANPSDTDEWRVQCYSPAGVFTWSAIKIPESGVVSMPRGHALLAQALAGGQAVQADRAATVGAVAALILTALQRAGLDTSGVDLTDLIEEV